LHADVLFIRMQSTIRADGPPSAQARVPQFEASSEVCSEEGAAIARFTRHRCAIDDPRGRFFVRATSQLCNDAQAI